MKCYISTMEFGIFDQFPPLYCGTQVQVYDERGFGAFQKHRTVFETCNIYFSSFVSYLSSFKKYYLSFIF